MALKKHPGIAALDAAGVTGDDDVVELTGLVAEVGKDTIELRTALVGGETLRVSARDVIHTEQSDPAMPATLYVRPGAIITIVEPATTYRRRNQGPSAADVAACVRASRERCIDTAMVMNGRTREQAEMICDNSQIAGLREAICRAGPFGGRPGILL